MPVLVLFHKLRHVAISRVALLSLYNRLFMKNQQSNSRRTFLRNLGAGASALSLPLFGYADNQFVQNETSGLYSLLTDPNGESLGQPGRKLGIALVGLGYYSKNLLAPALQETQKLSAGWHRNRNTRQGR